MGEILALKRFSKAGRNRQRQMDRQIDNEIDK